MAIRMAVASAAAAVALAGCGGSTAVVGPEAASPTTTTSAAMVTTADSKAGVHTRAAAEALARSLLRRVVLPSDAQRVRRSPAPVLDKAPQRTATPNFAQKTEFARSSLSMSAAMGFFARHPPRGRIRAGSGTGSSSQWGVTTSESVMDAIGGMPPGVAALLILTAAPLHSGGSGIRADAQLTWLPAKAAEATVPVDDHIAVVSRLKDSKIERRVVVTDPKTLAALRTAADGLPMSLPGPHGCPADFGVRVVVAFATGPGAPANRTFRGGFCDFWDETGPSGHLIAALGDDAAFDRAYQRVIGPGSP